MIEVIGQTTDRAKLDYDLIVPITIRVARLSSIGVGHDLPRPAVIGSARPSSLGRSVFPTVQSVCLWERTGRTTPGKVRTGRTIGGYSPSAWTSCSSQVEIIHHRTHHPHPMRDHSCRPRASPGVPCRPSPFPTILSCPRPSPAVPRRPPPLPYANMSHPVGPAVLPLGRPRRITDRRPVPSKVLGSPPTGSAGPRTVGNTA